MKLEVAHHFGVPPEQVFFALTDPETLLSCLDGCEKLVKLSDDTYDIYLKVGVAGIKGGYAGQVKITSQQPPEAMTLSVTGSGSTGFVKASAQMRLARKGNETDLSGSVDATIGGLIAAIGSRLIEAVAKKMAGEFFVKLEARIKARGAS